MVVKNLAGTPIFLLKLEDEEEIRQIDMSKNASLVAEEGYRSEGEWTLAQEGSNWSHIYLRDEEETVKEVLGLFVELEPGESKRLGDDKREVSAGSY